MAYKLEHANKTKLKGRYISDRHKHDIKGDLKMFTRKTNKRRET